MSAIAVTVPSGTVLGGAPCAELPQAMNVAVGWSREPRSLGLQISDSRESARSTPDSMDARSPHETQEARMTRDELLTRLSRLLPSQFEEVLFRANVPIAHLPGASAPQAARAIDAIRYLEQQNQLEPLARILEQVVTGPS